MSQFGTDPDYKAQVLKEDEEAFEEADTNTKDGLLDETEFGHYLQIKYEGKVKRLGGAVEPSADSNAKWYQALNSLHPEVEGVTKRDIKAGTALGK